MTSIHDHSQSAESWARPGAMCVCIDDQWEDVWPSGEIDEVPGPLKGDQVMVISVSPSEIGTLLKIVGWSMWWEAKAFRPLTAAEHIEFAVRSAPKDSFAPVREPERACLR